MGVEFYFEPTMTGVSAIASLAAVTFGFCLVSAPKDTRVSWPKLALAGFATGGGVSIMHYTGSNVVAPFEADPRCQE